MTEKLLRRSALLVLFIFFLNTLATFFFWYSRIWWFDMPMHFLGGLFIGLISVFLFEKYVRPRRPIARFISSPALFYIGVVAVIAVGWEYYELFIDMYFGTHAIHLLDTLSDICFDLAGGATSLLYIFARYPFYSPPKLFTKESNTHEG